MTHLEIIRDAYDRCGIVYALLRGEKGYSYVVLACTEKDKQWIESKPLDEILRRKNFLEFDAAGQMASY